MAVDDAVVQGVLELAGAGAQTRRRELVAAQVAKSVSTKDGVRQGHGVGFAAVERDAAVIVEPLVGKKNQWARSDGERDHFRLLHVLNDLLPEGEQPVVEELDQGGLVGHSQATQGRVGVQLLRRETATIQPGLFTTSRFRGLIQGPASGKKKKAKLLQTEVKKVTKNRLGRFKLVKCRNIRIKEKKKVKELTQHRR